MNYNITRGSLNLLGDVQKCSLIDRPSPLPHHFGSLFGLPVFFLFWSLFSGHSGHSFSDGQNEICFKLKHRWDIFLDLKGLHFNWEAGTKYLGIHHVLSRSPKFKANDYDWRNWSRQKGTTLVS